MLTTLDLQHAATSLFGSDFDGVYSINNLPKFYKTNTMFIFNTDTSNLPGTHWIAVLVKKNVGFVFDPFGNTAPTRIAYWLNHRNYQWSSNLRQVQPMDSILCGLYCIYYLWYASHKMLENELDVNIVTLLFPLHYTLYQHENIVRNFGILYLPMLKNKIK